MASVLLVFSMRTKGNGRELMILADEIYRTYHALQQWEDPRQSPGGRTGRAVLLSLSTDGNQTVPELARRRALSRQRMQQVVDSLIEQGLVETRPNPGHRKSYLLCLAAAGEKRAKALIREERKFFNHRLAWLSQRKISHCQEVLRELREDLERRRAEPER